MAFQTFGYFCFLAVMLIAYYALPQRFRWMLLLAGSYAFYMCWNATYALLMLFSTVVTFACGRLVGSAESVKAKKAWVTLSLVLNLGILFFFKYYGLFAETIRPLIQLPLLDVLLPVGISFYTFQALGYTLDVYRGDIAPAKHLGKYALFVSFFPQLVAGPIERSGNLLSQFDEKHEPNYERMREGALLILVGLIKKLVLADRLCMVVDRVYNGLQGFGAPAMIVATVCFSFQIYCDFSAYSDIAIGSAALFGFRLMRNFDRPYLSRSIASFWRRWHISLSGWFRDYVYIPLGGSRVNAARWAFNLLVVFLLSGLWHGAAWTFAAWGVLNGVYQIIGRFTKPLRDKSWHRLGIGEEHPLRICVSTVTTFVLVTAAWTLFRAGSFADVGIIGQKLVSGWETETLAELIYLVNGRECLLMFILTVAMMALEMAGNAETLTQRFFRLPWIVRWMLALAMLFLLILLGKYNESPAFIYFRF